MLRFFMGNYRVCLVLCLIHFHITQKVLVSVLCSISESNNSLFTRTYNICNGNKTKLANFLLR